LPFILFVAIFVGESGIQIPTVSEGICTHTYCIVEERLEQSVLLLQIIDIFTVVACRTFLDNFLSPAKGAKFGHAAVGLKERI
jgi:hypothetical protein